MRLIAILIPPLAVLLCGKFFQSIFNFLIWGIGVACIMFSGLGLLIIPLAIFHAWGVVTDKTREKQTQKVTRAQRAHEEPMQKRQLKHEARLSRRRR